MALVGKLYQTKVSPPARAVLLTEKALGIKLEHIEVNLMTDDQHKPEFLKLNPQHTIPLYIDQDGTKVWDSHAIIAYLVGKYGKTDDLYPKDLGKRAVVDQRMHFDTGNVFALVRSIVFPMWKFGEKNPTKRQIEDVNITYGFLDEFLKENQHAGWMAGDHMTIADLSLISSVSSLCKIVAIDAKYTNLLEWIAKCEALSFYDEANGQGVAVFEQFVIDLIKKSH